MHIVHPLNKILRNECPDAFRNLPLKQMRAFESLINTITSDPIRYLPQPTQLHSVHKDASDISVAFVLFKTNAQHTLCRIRFFSQIVWAARLNYRKTDNSRPTLFWSYRARAPNLALENFSVFTYENSLYWFFNIVELSGRLMHLRLLLPRFDFDIQYEKSMQIFQTDWKKIKVFRE